MKEMKSHMRTDETSGEQLRHNSDTSSDQLRLQESETTDGCEVDDCEESTLESSVDASSEVPQQGSAPSRKDLWLVALMIVAMLALLIVQRGF